MISSIRLKNFMSWEDEEFYLSPGINVFCGVSDKGKSAVVNAFEWFRTGRPMGFGFASDWIKKENKKGDLVLNGTCEVSIKLTEGIEITRALGKDINEYRVSSLKDPLKAFNKQVPQEVTDILNMSDINIQNQDNPYFIFALTPPEIGRQLNQIASLSDIDIAFTNADSSIRTLNAEIKKDEAILKNAKKELGGFDWLDTAEEQLIKVERISGQLTSVRNEEQKLRLTKMKIEELNKRLSKLLFVDQAQKNINELLETYYFIKKEQKEFNHLIDIEEKIISLNEKLKKSNIFSGANKKIKKLIILQTEIIKIENETDVLIDIEERITTLNDDFDKVSLEYNLLNTQYREMIPDVCPLCEQEWEKIK